MNIYIPEKALAVILEVMRFLQDFQTLRWGVHVHATVDGKNYRQDSLRPANTHGPMVFANEVQIYEQGHDAPRLVFFIDNFVIRDVAKFYGRPRTARALDNRAVKEAEAMALELIEGPSDALLKRKEFERLISGGYLGLTVIVNSTWLQYSTALDGKGGLIVDNGEDTRFEISLPETIRIQNGEVTLYTKPDEDSDTQEPVTFAIFTHNKYAGLKLREILKKEKVI